MEPLDASARAHFWQQIEEARAMTPEQRMIAGVRMFETACDELRTRIRDHFPDAPEPTVQALVRIIVRAAERRGIL